MKFLEFKKNSLVYTPSVDRYYTKLSEYLDDPYIRIPKIEGVWELYFVDPKFPDYKALLTLEPLSCQSITVFVRPELLPVQKKSSAYSDYLEKFISVFPSNVSDRAASEIFNRCKGDESLIASALEELKKLPYPEITVEVVSRVLAPINTVWASDVVASLFVYPSDTIPRRGHSLSGYKWKNPLALLNEHRNSLGNDISFYSIRKSLRSLYEGKVKYLNCEDTKAQGKMLKLIENTDIYSIAYAHILFQTSAPSSLVAICTDILRRQQNHKEEARLLDVSIHRR